MNAGLEGSDTMRLHVNGQCWLIAAATAMLSLVLSGCEYSKNIQEYPEAWKSLEPGQRRNRFPTPRVITEGGGAIIGPGDLVQLNLRTKFGEPVPTWQSDGDWWIWIGFRIPKETRFFAVEPRIASALVGIREGTVLEFADSNDGAGKDPEYAGVLRVNVIGDKNYYEWRKPGKPPFANVSIYISTAKFQR